MRRGCCSRASTHARTHASAGASAPSARAPGTQADCGCPAPGLRPASGGKEPMLEDGPGDSDDSLSPPSGGRPSSGGAAGILATLVPTGFRQPHMIESMAQGGPSHASGQVQPGDLLLEVDGADVRTLSLRDIQTKIIGRSGTRVTLTLQRGKRNFPHKVTLTRSVPPPRWRPRVAGLTRGRACLAAAATAAYCRDKWQVCQGRVCDAKLRRSRLRPHLAPRAQQGGRFDGEERAG